MRNFITILLFILWLLLGWYYYTDWNTCCGDEGTVTELSENEGEDDDGAITDVDTTSTATGNDPDPGSDTYSVPLVSQWSTPEITAQDGWDTYRDSLTNSLEEDELIEISGYYREGETNETDVRNLGLARAGEIKRLFGNSIAGDRIKVSGVPVEEKEGDRSNYFEACAISTFKDAFEIKEIDDKTFIYFPSNSVSNISDPALETYLNDLVTIVSMDTTQQNGISLTGHTDSQGTASYNMALGQQRADAIKNYLVNRGIPSANIISTSKGETEPVATNATEEGRSKNRRVELQIIK